MSEDDTLAATVATVNIRASSTSSIERKKARLDFFLQAQ
jgi:hypothetical protein